MMNMVGLMMELLILKVDVMQNGRADHILLTGLIGNVVMRAQAK